METATTSNLEPIRQPPIVTRPVTNPDLLRLLLENIRQHVEKSQAGLKSAISHRIGGQNPKNSDSNESDAQHGSVSSDSSDES